MKYEELFAHIVAKTEIRVAVASSRSKIHTANIGLPVRIFKRLKSGRIRQYVEVHTRSGKVQKVDLCRIRHVNNLSDAM